jgi:TctA family transporter
MEDRQSFSRPRSSNRSTHVVMLVGIMLGVIIGVLPLGGANGVAILLR